MLLFVFILRSIFHLYCEHLPLKFFSCFSLLYPVVIFPLEGLLESIFLQILKTSFLAFAFSLQMSKSKIMVHCWCFGKGGVGKGVCSLYTLVKSTYFTCSVRDLVCTNSSSLLASTSRRHWNSKQAFWKWSAFSDPFPHIQSEQISQGTLWTWYKSKYEWQFCLQSMNIDLFCQHQGCPEQPLQSEAFER